MVSLKRLLALPLLSTQSLLPLLLLLLFLSPAAPAHAAPGYRATWLPAQFTPFAINNAGDMAGIVSVGDASHAGVLARGAVADLGTLGGAYSWASAINDAGQVAGTSATRDPDTSHAFLYSQGKMADIDGRGPGTVSSGLALNASGHVAGQFGTAGNRLHAYVWAGRGLRDLGTLGGTTSLAWDIDDAGVVVGESTLPGNGDLMPPSHPFVYRDGAMHDLGVLQDGPYTANAAQRIDAGVIAGFGEVDGAFHVAVYERGMVTDLGFFGGRALQVNGINRKGQFVGTADSPAGELGFLSMDGQLFDLSTLVVGAGGWQITSANGINDKGQIVGSACRGFTCGPVRLDPVSRQR